MTLLETTEIISEYAEVRVFNCDGDEIARYNGKDSIPSYLNRETVDNISAGIDYFGNGIPYISIRLAERTEDKSLDLNELQMEMMEGWI